MIYVFDIDGTIANNEHRSHLLPSSDLHLTSSWSDYNRACSGDSPIIPMINMMNALAELSPVYIMTSRSDEVECMTLEWLQCNDIEYDGIYMRSRFDNSKDYIIKEKWLNDLCKGDKKNVIIFEDNPNVISHLRNCGYTVMSVCEYKVPPKDCKSHGE